MFENFAEQLDDFIDSEGRDLKYKLKDKLLPVNFDCTPFISYDFLLLDSSEYSFHNPEINNSTSETHINVSDSQIYFQKIQEICKSNFGVLRDEYKDFQIINNPNKNLKKVADTIFSKKLTNEEMPPFFEIKLYTNKITNKAPRIFGFIGNVSALYVLFYDPFHKIFDKTGKI